jgi:RHS repeat-associated protein
MSTVSGALIEENSYYPFGMLNNGLSSQDYSDTTNNYKYNGKELQKELSLGWLDYGARFYDPVIGRCTTIDPLAEKSSRFSTYTYGDDNSIRFIDPDGMEAINPDEFNLDTKTGNIDKVSNLGGNVTDTYNIGTTDKKGVFTSSQKIIIGRGGDNQGAINTFRIEETDNSTTSAFNIPGTNISGFILEPAGPSTTVSKQDKRIPEATYNLDNHSSDDHPNSFVLFNNDVPKGRQILIHPGNNGDDTGGCLLPGITKKTGIVENSGIKTKEVYKYIRKVGPQNVKVHINNVISLQQRKER